MEGGLLPRKLGFCGRLVTTSPVVGRAGSSAYNDLAEAALLFGVFYLLQIWDENRESNLLILIGLLGGLAWPGNRRIHWAAVRTGTAITFETTCPSARETNGRVGIRKRAPVLR
jgi:hypothetical protein